MNVAMLGAGAGGMYCGSCLRDNALAQALVGLGHHVVLVPLYTPMKTDTPGAAGGEVFYGGVNAWLQFASGIFRFTPRAVDWLLDRPWLLKKAGEYGSQTSPAKLGPFTVSILKGDEGPQVKELRRLVRFLQSDAKRPEVVTLPNAMFIGLARMLKAELRCPVVCELTGENLFLDNLSEPHKGEAREIIRKRAADVDRFVATSTYYADRMADYLGVPRERIAVIHPGIPAEQIATARRHDPPRPPTIGYFARICPEKGIQVFLDAARRLREKPGMENARFRAAGYLGAINRPWWEDQLARANRDLKDAFAYEGEVDLAEKLKFYDGIDVFSVPTTYAEPKGISIIEAMGRGVPVVQPAHGSFPELVGATGGGVLVKPNDPMALAEAWASLLSDATKREDLGRSGIAGVRERFTADRMARSMLSLFEGLR